MDLAAISFLLLMLGFLVPALIVAVGPFTKKARLRSFDLVLVALLIFVAMSFVAALIDRVSGTGSEFANAIFAIDIILFLYFLVTLTVNIFSLVLSRRQLGSDPDFDRIFAPQAGAATTGDRRSGDGNITERRDDSDNDFECTSRLLGPRDVDKVDTGVVVNPGLNTYAYRFVLAWQPDDDKVAVAALAKGRSYPWYVQAISFASLAVYFFGTSDAYAETKGYILECKKDTNGNCLIIGAPGKDQANQDEFSAAVTVNVIPVFPGGAGTDGSNLKDTVQLEASAVATLEGQLAIQKVGVGLNLKGKAQSPGDSPAFSLEAGASANFDIIIPGQPRQQAGIKTVVFTYECARKTI